MLKGDQKIVKLLWTGGWDSTFRLLQLLIVQKQKVQPYYIIDSDRLSTRMELWTMKEVRYKIIAEYPELSELFLPTKIKELHDIIRDNEIVNSFVKLIKKKSIGDQYSWLASFAKQEKMEHLELSVVKSDNGTSTLVEEFLHHLIVNGVDTNEIDQKYKGTNVYTVFKYFSLSSTYLSKIEIQKIAEKYGFLHILNNSWFCHKPLKNGKPCGICKPCTVIMKSGMPDRLPAWSRFRYHIRFFINKKQLKMKFPGLYSKFKHFKINVN